jgi:uncharacterized protein
MGYSSALPASRCWPAPREFVLLNGDNAEGEVKMKRLSGFLLGFSVALALAFSPQPAGAQQPPQAAPLKPVSPSAMQAARDLLAAKGVNQIYANAIPNIVQRAKDQFLANNLSYQKDLNEVAIMVAQTEAGKDKEIGEQMAKIYANDFTEQELKDLTAFYKSPLGQKLQLQEPKSIQASMLFMNQWAQALSENIANEFRAEMKKRGKPLG